MFQKTYIFEENLNNNQEIYVDKSKLYSPEGGYGFVTEENTKEQELLQIPALASGFMHKDIVEPLLIPVMFKTNVEHQGNFRVEIEAENDGSEAIIFLERRRLSYVGKFTGTKTFVFSVNVTDIIPEFKERIYTDTDLDITWVGDGIKVKRIDIKEVNIPTIYIAGDSTVADQLADYPYSPGVTYSGWGQMLSAYVNENVAVSNHAHSGLTTDTFRKEGHYSIISQYIKPKDYFFIQFGHNDQKHDELREDTGYRDNLVRYITEIRSQGAFPVIVTSLARNSWKNEGEEYNDYLVRYANECIKIGKEMNVPVLDLHKISMDLIKKEGLVESKKYFHPNDYTHTNDYGAYLIASYIADEMRKVAKSSKAPAYKMFESFLRDSVEPWEIDRSKLVPPTIQGETQEVKEEPYQIAMDRLDEILRRK